MVVVFLFVRMDLLRARIATAIALFSAILFLVGGILGSVHHLYFTGTSLAVLATVATFRGSEVVSLMFINFEASQNQERTNNTWEKGYSAGKGRF
ncbi:MAG TPA: hypothetical protein VKA68_06025 [bacterium]|nr:hypothetical protein [bacterium]